MKGSGGSKGAGLGGRHQDVGRRRGCEGGRPIFCGTLMVG
jgi:hypothetical protein